jgi:hypothetical protein
MTSTIEGNNSGVTLEATVEEGDPRSGLKNVMGMARVPFLQFWEKHTKNVFIQV